MTSHEFQKAKEEAEKLHKSGKTFLSGGPSKAMKARMAKKMDNRNSPKQKKQAMANWPKAR